LLSYHFEKSNNNTCALQYLKIAANHAFNTFANHEAKELYTQVLALFDQNDYGSRWDILAAREQTLDRLGERDQQATDLTIMQTLAELLNDDQRLAMTHNRRAAYFDKISEYQASDEAAGAGLRVARRAQDVRLEAQSLNALALTAWRRFDYRQVQNWASQALDALKIVGDPNTRIISLLHLGRASYRLGQYDTALEYIRAAQALATETDNRSSDALAELILGWIYQRLGSYEKAAQHYQLMLEKRRLIGDRYGEATALSHLGWVAADQKIYNEGLAYCQQALDISQAITDRENEAYALSGLGLNYELSGNPAAAGQNYEAALDIHRQIGATTLAIFDQAGLARLALTQEKVDVAREYITAVAEWILAGNAQQFWDPWILYLSAYRVLTALQETETARQILEEAHTILHQRASEISDERLQHHFREMVETNREIEAAWQAVK
jgi:tetratricopeptide (TPR) repeat protein